MAATEQQIDLVKLAVPAVSSTGLIVVSVIFPILSLGTLALRFRARQKSSQQYGTDDWVMLISWVLSFGLSIMVWVFASITGVNHYFNTDLKTGTEYSTMLVLLTGAYFMLPLAAVKIAILLFYKRIFCTPKFAAIVKLMIPVVASWGVIFFWLILLQSDPVRGSWTGEGYLRFDTFALGLAQSGSSIALDILILCLPIPLIFGLHMATKRKLAIISIFWLGIFCCVAASVRLWLVYTTLKQVIASHGQQGYDAIYYQTKNMIFAIIEPYCSIIAGCLPCYGPFFDGGHSTESLLRSVRSVFSLRSSASRSNNSISKAQTAANGRRNSQGSGIELNSVAQQLNTTQGKLSIVNSLQSQHKSDRQIGANQIHVTQEVAVSSV